MDGRPCSVISRGLDSEASPPGSASWLCHLVVLLSKLTFPCFNFLIYKKAMLIIVSVSLVVVRININTGHETVPYI